MLLRLHRGQHKSPPLRHLDQDNNSLSLYPRKKSPAFLTKKTHNHTPTQLRGQGLRKGRGRKKGGRGERKFVPSYPRPDPSPNNKPPSSLPPSTKYSPPTQRKKKFQNSKGLSSAYTIAEGRFTEASLMGGGMAFLISFFPPPFLPAPRPQKRKRNKKKEKAKQRNKNKPCLR